MRVGRVHVVGAGLSGLSAALWLARAGIEVVLHESAGHAGGRCRSFDDPALERRIDNGNHLVLGGNREVHAYLAAVGGLDGLTGPERAEFPFIDVATGERWTVRPGRGPVPWWILLPSRRVPGSRPGEYLKALRLAFCRREATVGECLAGTGVLFRRFWEPLTVAALNARPEEAAAALLWPVVRETFGRGEASCRPRIARVGLSECFVEPALAALGHAGAVVRLHRRLQEIRFADDGVQGIAFADGETTLLDRRDALVLAVSPVAAAGLVPDLQVPRGHRAIVNAHFRLAAPTPAAAVIGVVGGLSQWIFVRGDVASVTVSAGDAVLDEPAEALARRMWPEVRLALGLDGIPRPPFRIVKERRATFAQIPDNLSRRPPARTRWRNLVLAGDWTDTGLPATIEGSLRSGRTAAAAILASAAST